MSRSRKIERQASPCLPRKLAPCVVRPDARFVFATPIYSKSLFRSVWAFPDRPNKTKYSILRWPAPADKIHSLFSSPLRQQDFQNFHRRCKHQHCDLFCGTGGFDSRQTFPLCSWHGSVVPCLFRRHSRSLVLRAAAAARRLSGHRPAWHDLAAGAPPGRTTDRESPTARNARILVPSLRSAHRDDRPSQIGSG